MNHHYQNSKNFQTQQTDNIITAQAIYQTLIRQTPNLYPIHKFKTTKGSSKQLFPDALKYPDFFNYNLVSPGRVIKKIQGSQSVIRGFYYQLMKLAFQIQIEERDYIEVLKNVIFSPEFMLQQNPSSPSSGKNCSDLQYKKIVAEFMEILMNQSIPNFQLTILNYPIVDEAMIKILQNLLKFKSSMQISINPNAQILQKLSQIFEVTVVQYGNCYKFQQSDIFLYEHSPSQFYIAFLNQMAQMSDISQSSKRISNNEQESSKRINKNTSSANQDQDQQFDYSGQSKKRKRTHIHSQFQLQTPVRQSQRQCSSNLAQNKHKGQKENKPYRNTYGFNEIKLQQQDYLPQTDKKPQKQILQIQNRQSRQSNNRYSRQSIIHQLHKLVHQSTQSHNNQNFKVSRESFNIDVTIPDSKLVTSITNPHSIFTQIQSMRPQLLSYQNNKTLEPTSQNYQYQTKGYSKNITYQQPMKNLIHSTQSDEVIGYSDFTHGIKTQNNVGKDYQYTFNRNQDFTGFIKQTPLINASVKSYNQNINNLESTRKQNQDLLYNPKGFLNKHTYMQPPPNKYNYRKEDQSLGTLYRQFTDTKVLQVLPRVTQDNIRRMRGKFKGVHAKNYFGLK